MVSEEGCKGEIRRAFKYFYMGTTNIYEEYYITSENSGKIAKGLEYIEHGSVILHYLSLVDGYPELEGANLFPLDFQEALKLIKTNTIDDLSKKFKVIEVFGEEFLGKEINFYKEALLEKDKRKFAHLFNV